MRSSARHSLGTYHMDGGFQRDASCQPGTQGRIRPSCVGERHAPCLAAMPRDTTSEGVPAMGEAPAAKEASLMHKLDGQHQWLAAAQLSPTTPSLSKRLVHPSLRLNGKLRAFVFEELRSARYTHFPHFAVSSSMSVYCNLGLPGRPFRSPDPAGGLGMPGPTPLFSWSMR